MENNINAIIEDSKTVVGEIYSKINTIEQCKLIVPVLEETEVCLLREDKSTINLDNILSVEQRADLLYGIRSMINKNIDDAANELKHIIQANKEPEKAVVEDKQPVPLYPNLVPRTSKMKIEAVQEMVDKGMTVEEIADHYGYRCTETVRKFIKNNKIVARQEVKMAEAEPAEHEEIKLEVKEETEAKSETKAPIEPLGIPENVNPVGVQSKPLPRVLTEDDIPVVESNYTNGSMSVGELASVLGTSKKQAYSFIQENRLEKNRW